MAVTTKFVTTFTAGAVQISAVPACALARDRMVHVRPPPVTAVIRCEPLLFGPSEAIKTTRSSFGWAVLMLGELMLLPPDACLVVTVLSRTGADDTVGVVTEAAFESFDTLPAASYARTIYV